MSNTFHARLSAEQQDVVQHLEGPILVVAGPGSGKTRVLTERIRHLLTTVPGHFRVLALTFTNKAADEMRERLSDLSQASERAFIGTIHSFCLDILSERGKGVGVIGMPHIFEQFKDRKDVLIQAVRDDPWLRDEIGNIEGEKERSRRLDGWLHTISHIKAHPISCAVVEDPMMQRVIEAYDAGMRACNAYDFDDLLLLTYQLLTSTPNLANFYRRLYPFVCIDEAQDMNEGQYALISTFCAEGHRNLMMVGDPKQSIYGFNTSSPEFMERFKADFSARTVELTANYRSSKWVVYVAQTLEPSYLIQAQLPIDGSAAVIRGTDEEDESRQVVDEMVRLFEEGHSDVEGGIQPSKCAVLGRTRFALLGIEKELRKRSVPFFKRLTSNHENESPIVEDFHIALRILANPLDRLHLSALARRWKVVAPASVADVLSELKGMVSKSIDPASEIVLRAIEAVTRNPSRVDLMPALKIMEKYAATLEETDKRVIFEDIVVFREEWDQYLRATSGVKSIGGFLSNKALGATQKSNRAGVALLTVHASKGLEFEVVFIAGMAEGTFPDYRANSVSTLAEEARNAFVAVTRSKRLLYLSYPALKLMPWGDTRRQNPSRFIPGRVPLLT